MKDDVKQSRMLRIDTGDTWSYNQNIGSKTAGLVFLYSLEIQRSRALFRIISIIFWHIRMFRVELETYCTWM